MLAAEPILYSLEWNWNMVDTALEGLDDAALARQPSDQCNSAAWILWHMNRVLDTLIHTRLRSMPQLWVSEGWHRKYGMDEDPEERGVGWTAEQVSSWQPPSATSNWILRSRQSRCQGIHIVSKHRAVGGKDSASPAV